MKFEDVLPALKEGKKVRRSLWPKDEYIFRVNNLVCNEKNDYWCPADFDNILRDDWEIIKESEYDWDYIIENECPCWFWDIYEDGKVIGSLNNVHILEKCPYADNLNGLHWKHCRPVRPDEINFYEDKEDEDNS